MRTDRTAQVTLAAGLIAAAMVLGGCGDEPTGDPEPPSTGSGAIPAELDSVQADVQRVAPALESWSRDHGYATTLPEALQALDDAGLEPTAPNVVGGYLYDADAVEFVLCIETPSGTHATFDTSPMVVTTAGASGGCSDD